MKAEDLRRLRALREKCRDTLAQSKLIEAQLEQVIVERNRIVKGLSSSHAQFRVIADNIRELLWLSDPARTAILFITQRCEEMLFHKPADFRRDARCFLDVVHPEDRADVERYLETPTRQIKETAFRVIGPDGSVLWLRERCVPVVDDEGEVTVLAGVTEDVTESRTAQEAIARAYEGLEEKVRERTGELQKASEDIRRLADHLDTIREEENRRIAQEIHDVLGQTLTAAKLRVASFKSIKSKPSVGDLQALEDMLGEMAEDVRRISHTLRPTILDHFGLAAALEWMAEEFQKTARMPCSIAGNWGQIDVDSGTAINVFRICQEALNNVVKHAKASRVDLKLVAEDGTLEVVIADNGQGFKPAEVHRKGMGLVGMRERALRFGGEVRVETAPLKGTTVRLRIPVPLPERRGAAPDSPDLADSKSVK